MKVQVYAALKEHFEREFIVGPGVATTAELLEYLTRSKPETLAMLSKCRFAVNDEFVDMNFKIREHDTVSIIPPSSGG